MDDPTVSMTGEGPRHSSTPLGSWGPFRLIEKVGQGGFGEVYRAWDDTLKREVAVKLLLESRADDGAGYNAVLKEARLMARVRHPNIVPVYGVDQHNGRVGFWSDFVRGKTLSELLKTQGPFGAREAALIGVELCRAVSAVHAAGLLHRDIKTGNVMREEGGRILLMDFGLTHRSTETGVGGTPPYMAPELFSGSPATVASDIYALGVLLFHLVTGKYPIEASRLSDFAKAHEARTRRRLVDERPDIPEPFARVIETALDADPRKRFASPGEMMSALSEGIGTAPVAVPKPPSLRTAFIAAAAVAAAGIVFSLTPWRTILSPARNAMFTGVHADYVKAQDLLDTYYKPNNLDNAISLFQKTIEKDKRFPLAYAGLARAYWREYVDTRDRNFIPKAQGACSKALELGEDLASVHVTLGMIYTEGGRSDLATQELEKALRLDKRNAEAYAAFSDLYKKQGRDAEVEPALRKAIDLTPTDWRWPNQLGVYYMTIGNPAQAEVQFRQAASLSPENPRTLNNLAMAYKDLERFAEARAALEKSISILPAYPSFSNLGNILLQTGDYAKAAAMYQRSIDLNPTSYLAHANLASALLWAPGERDKAGPVFLKAIELAEKYRKDRPKDAPLLASLGSYYASVGNAGKSVPLLRQAVALEPDSPQVLFRAGEGYELLHQRDEALRWIGKAVEHGFSLAYINRSPELADLRADSRFLAIANQKK
jgi:serine/threonine protein kinase/Flp pilus assembly protein TadD